jgi:Raf kinase inhibitor-like YbhB/YbcL family protein
MEAIVKYFQIGIVALSALAAAPASAFELTSPDVANGGTLKAAQISNVFGCSGGNISPALRWKDAPEGTRSFVVTLYDPDAPTGSGWWHWTIFDIPASATFLPGGAGSKDGKALPAGAFQGRNDAGAAAFLGACPPPGPAHRYILTITALKVEKLGLDSNAGGALVGFMTKANALGTATITATYGQ